MVPTRRADFPFPVPIVSAIIGRRRGNLTEVLVQVRWKPEKDPVYTGTFEIPARKCRGQVLQSNIWARQIVTRRSWVWRAMYEFKT